MKRRQGPLPAEVRWRSRVGARLAPDLAVVLAAGLLVWTLPQPRGSASPRVAPATAPATATATAPATQATPGSPVVLHGGGGEGPAPEMTAWAQALFHGAPSPALVSYAPGSSLGAQQQFIAGDTDFVVSGLGFDATQAAQLRSGRGFVAVPLQPDALGFAVAAASDYVPAPSGWNGPLLHAGPLRMPASNMGLALMGLAGAWGGLGPANGVAWPDGESVAAAESFVDIQGSGSAAGGDEVSFLEQYLDTVAPALWAQQRGSAPAVSPAWPSRVATVRDDAPEVIASLVSEMLTNGQGVNGAFGVIGTIPPNQFALQPPAQPAHLAANFSLAQLQNAAGDWVGPSAATVEAAIVEGGGRPLSALTDPGERGAYPLSWVDELYAPASGLPVDKTNALATFIRYAVTTGRQAAAAVGDAVLPDSLARQAQDAANQIVLDNCTEPGTSVVATGDPGEFAPAHSLDGLGTMLVCVPPAPSPAASGSAGAGSPGPGAAPGSSGPASSGGSARAPAASAGSGTPSPASGTAGARPGPGSVSPAIAVLGLGPIGPSSAEYEAPSETALAPVLAESSSPPAPAAAAAARLPYGLPFNAPQRTYVPITLLLGALLYWRAEKRIRRWVRNLASRT